jgi:hypothetical protein
MSEGRCGSAQRKVVGISDEEGVMISYKKLATLGVAVVAATALAIGAIGVVGADPTPTPGGPGMGPWGMRGAMMAGGFGPRMASHGAGMHGAGMQMHGAGMDEVAALLGMTQEELQAERQSGKSLLEIAQAKGVTEEQLVATLRENHQAHLAEKVAAGYLTQEQADQMLAHMAAQTSQMITRTDVGPMGHGPGTGPCIGDGTGVGPGAMGPGMMRQGGPGMMRQGGPGMMFGQGNGGTQ